MADGSGATRIDMLLESRQGLISGIEVKTGDEPFLTDAQLLVYPHLMMGYSVITPNLRIHTLGLTPMTLLPPIPVFQFYLKDAHSDQKFDALNPRELVLQLLRRRAVRGIGKLAGQILAEEGTSR